MNRVYILCTRLVPFVLIMAIRPSLIQKEVNLIMKRILLLLLLQVILIALNAVFACAEIAVLSINEAKLKKMAEDGNRSAKRLSKLTREPAKFLATIQVAITLSGFLGSAFAADNFSEPLVNWLLSLGVPETYRGTLDTVAVIVITLILSYFTLVFGELVPKRLAMKKSEKIAMGISGPLRFIAVLFTPIVWFLSVSTNVVLRICGVNPHEQDEEVSEEDIRIMVDAGSESGTIDTQEKEFIQNIFEFNDLTAGEIATHRTDVTILLLDDDDAKWAATIHESRHTLYPVCDGSADKVTGILNAKDYFRLEDKSRSGILAGAVRPVYFIPETTKADVLFRNMKKDRHSMAVVVDEYGGMVGIVTIHDLMEELVGDIDHEADAPDEDTPFIEKTAEDTWRIHGNVRLDELEDATGRELTSDSYDTFSGLVFDELSKIPEDGAHEIELDCHGLHVLITRIDGHQIEEAVVTLLDEEGDTEEDDEDDDED